jgi:hypothetical protein
MIETTVNGESAISIISKSAARKRKADCEKLTKDLIHSIAELNMIEQCDAEFSNKGK